MGKYSYWVAEAESGDLFTYVGEADECRACGNRERCHGSLKVGLTYRIIMRTGGEKVYCGLRNCMLVPYEITPEPLTLLIPSSGAKEGAIIEVKTSFCKKGCQRIEECPVFLNMLLTGTKVRVLKKIGSFDCPRSKLVLVSAELLD
ncbi:MAG: UPF0179 family protein [Thermoproteota archaeon]